MKRSRWLGTAAVVARGWADRRRLRIEQFQQHHQRQQRIVW